MNINPLTVLRRGILSGSIISDRDNPECQVQQVGIDLTLAEDITVEPQSFVNTLVNEVFDMQDTFGVMQVRSSLSRKGVFISSGVYDPGFKGLGGLSVYNMSKNTITLPKGFRVGQLIVFEGDYSSLYDGHYNSSSSVDSKYEEIR